MAMAHKVAKTKVCRYGHGALERQGLQGVERGHFYAQAGTPASATEAGVLVDTGYWFSIYKCPHCSYIELHDDDDEEGS